jgi:hypothetical protein
MSSPIGPTKISVWRLPIKVGEKKDITKNLEFLEIYEDTTLDKINKYFEDNDFVSATVEDLAELVDKYEDLLSHVNFGYMVITDPKGFYKIIARGRGVKDVEKFGLPGILKDADGIIHPGCLSTKSEISAGSGALIVVCKKEK